MNKTELLNRFAKDGDERLVLARALDRAQQAQMRGIPAHTDFLTPAQRAAVGDMLAAAGGPPHLFYGGWPEAERTVCAFLPPWQSEEDWLADGEKPVCAVRCTFSPRGGGLTHRDFLGGLMGTGLTREKVGDILVGEGVCDILVLREAAAIVADQFHAAGRTPVEAVPIPLEELSVPQAREGRLLRDTVAALRLDAVAAAGFSLSRGKAAALVSSGQVSVNHRPCAKPDGPVEEGDVLSCRGLGRCVLRAVLGQSRKGRIMIEIERYS